MAFRVSLQFAQLAILARLLSPADFGLVAVSSSVVILCQSLNDLGMGSSVIHHRTISREQFSSLYWANVVFATLLTLGLLLLSPVLSHQLFQLPALQEVLVVQSFTILIAALGQQLRIRLEKSLDFAVIARVEILGALTGFVVAVAWALQFRNAYALVAGYLVNASVQSLLLYLWTPRTWRPQWRLQLAEISQHLKFGGYVTGNNLLNLIATQADLLLAGRMLTPDTVGYYSVPRNLSLSLIGVFNPVVTRVGFPLMSEIQNDRERLADTYRKTVAYTSALNMPLFLGLAVFAEDVVAILFGADWGKAAVFLQWLALWGAIRSIGNPVGAVVLAVGRAQRLFFWNLGLALSVPLLLFFAMTLDATALAVAQATIALTLVIPAWYWLVRPCTGLSLSAYLYAIAKPTALALVSVLLAFWLCDDINVPLVRLMSGVAVGAVTYIVLTWLWNREWLYAMLKVAGKTE